MAAAIVRVARLDRDNDAVLEVGPGLGVLTRRLVGAAERVVAIELDAHLADWLRTEFATANLVVQTADVLKMDPASLFTAPYVVVANLPYHITSPVVRHLLAAGPPFARRLVLMVQAEVAERMSATPGQMSALAVAVQIQATVRLARRVPAAAFYPRPKVDSAVLVLEPLADDDRLVARAELDGFVRLVQAGFKQPRKQLGNSLAEGLGVPKSVALELLARADLDPARRAQELDLADWARLWRTSSGQAEAVRPPA